MRIIAPEQLAAALPKLPKNPRTAIPLIDGDPFATWMLLPLALCACAAAFIINARRGKESPPVDWS